MCEVIANNNAWPCYLRPIVLRGYGEAGVNPFNSPTEVYVVNYPWGKYLTSEAEGCDVCVSSWTRLAPNTLPAMAKAGANYMNSQLIKMEAVINGYAEGIALDSNGYVSEGSGENVFIVRNGVLQTAAAGQLGVAGHHARLGAADCARPEDSCHRAGDPARIAVSRGRGLLYRDRGGGHADPFGRQDQRRQGQSRVQSPGRFATSSMPL